MDLTTMSFKVADGLYTSKDGFRQDLKQIIANAVLYNISGIVVDQARELDAIFEKQWARVMKTLGDMESQAYHPPPAIDYPPPPAAIPAEYRQPPPPAHYDPIPYEEPRPAYQEPSRSATPSAATPTASTGFKLKFSMPKPQAAPLPPPPSAQPPMPIEPVYYPPPPPPPHIEDHPAEPSSNSVPPTPTSSGFKLKFKIAAPALPTPVDETMAESPAVEAPPAPISEPIIPSRAASPVPVLAPVVAAPPPPPPPSYINLVPPPPFVAPPPPAVSKPSGFKIKFNTSATASTPTLPPAPAQEYKKEKKEKSHKPPKIKTFDEDIDEMFTAKPKAKSHSMSASSSSSMAPEKKKVISYVESPSPPPMFETFEKKPVANMNGGDSPDPSQYFKRSSPINLKKVKAVMKKTVDCPESFFFRDPVEAVGGLAM